MKINESDCCSSTSLTVLLGHRKMATTLSSCPPLIHAVDILPLPYTTVEDNVSLFIITYCTPAWFTQSTLNSFTGWPSLAETSLNPLKFFIVTNAKWVHSDSMTNLSLSCKQCCISPSMCWTSQTANRTKQAQPIILFSCSSTHF